MSANAPMPNELSSAAVATAMEADIKRRVSSLVDEAELTPRLLILSDNYLERTPTKQYIDLKAKVGHRLGMRVVHEEVSPLPYMGERIEWHNEQAIVQGIIVQLPLRKLRGEAPVEREEITSSLLDRIAPEKDVDGLGVRSPFEPATPLSIVALLESNGINFKDHKTVIRGRGRLVGDPLFRILRQKNVEDLVVIDINTPEDERRTALNESTLVISATGQGHGLTPASFDNDHPRIVVDAGTAEQKGGVVGDVSDKLRKWGAERGWRFTPEKGGVGRLTVLTLLQHVVEASEQLVDAPDYVPPQLPEQRKMWWLPSIEGLQAFADVDLGNRTVMHRPA